jgi:site-specific DNA-methyltransferase (adenine-specific)
MTSLREQDFFGGRIRLVHGDAIEVMRLLDPASVDMIFCDPPYGHNNNNNDLAHRWEQALGLDRAQQDPRPILNDGVEATPLFASVMALAARALKPGCCCCCCCCCGGGPEPQFARWSLILASTPQMQFKMAVVWDKGPMGLGWHYRRSYEMVLVAQRTGAACAWYDDSGAIENIIRPGDHGIRKIIPISSQHPTEKPITLAAHFIRLHSALGELVVDPFMGAGSTGIAAARMGRRFVGVELDKHWYDVACQRMADEERQGDLMLGANELSKSPGLQLDLLERA